MGKLIEKWMPWSSDTCLNIDFFVSEPIGNFFDLHAAIFEISVHGFVIKPPAC